MRGRIRTALGAAVVAATMVGAALVAPAAAGDGTASGPQAASAGSRIVYVCWPNLCAVDPATGATVQITTDGRGYERPSISADGTRLAAAAWGENTVGAGPALVAGDFGSNLAETWANAVRGLKDAAISPDGKQVSASYWYTELKYKYCYPGPTCLEIEHYNATNTWTAPQDVGAVHVGSSGVGYLGSSLLSTDSETVKPDPEDYETWTYNDTVCVVASPADDNAACAIRVREPSPQAPGGPSINISDPVGSPDGSVIAATLGDVPQQQGRIVDNPTGENPRINLYNGATGAKIVQVAANGFSPSFSPDGRQIVYQGTDNMLYVVPSAGGAPRALVAGMHPTWGPVPEGAAPPGAAAPGQVVKSKKPLRVKRSRIALKISCPATATSGCAGKARLRTKGKRSKPITKASRYRLDAGRSAKVKLKLTRKGANALRKGRTTKALALLEAKGQPVVRTKVTIRR